MRRPLPRRLAAAAVGATLLAFAGGIVVVLTGSNSGQVVQAVAEDAATSSPTAGDSAQFAAAIEARAQLRAGRNRTSPQPTPEPGPGAAAEQAPATPAPADPAAAPEPAPVPVPVVVGQLWAAADVNVRADPSTGQEPIAHLGAVTQVDVTGATENGWTQVVTDGVAGWVKSSFLSESKPEPPAAGDAGSSGVSGAACPISASIESNLTGNARAVYRAVCAAFGGSVSSFGGYRAGDGGDHGSGRAVDIMVSGDPGWDIVRYVQAHAGELNVSYVIYQQQIWQAGNATGQWKFMEDRGSTTANHYDHVHVSVS